MTLFFFFLKKNPERNQRTADPFCLTSIGGKMLQMLIRNQMGKPKNRFKLFKGSQHGFTKLLKGGDV